MDSFDEDREEVISRALASGVKYLFLPNIDSSSIRDLGSITSRYPDRIFGMIGLHPTSVKADYREQMGVVEMELKENRANYCAIGEIGIDLYWDKTFAREQEDVFVRQLELSLEYNLPVVIHTRNSMDIALEICAEHRAQGTEHRAQGAEHRAQGTGHRAESSGKMVTSQLKTANCQLLRGVFHCFSGNLRQAQRAIDLGFMLGIGGVVTFKNSGLQEVVEAVPLEYLLLETDAPFLAPVPFRGKRNEPAYIPLIAEKIAEIKQTTIEEVAEVTTAGALKLFSK
ncbi:MAG: TatD family hydrolase [Bacteroidales bacterium]|nr:TatD family hydrolase [Bacteroidales bacterium]